MKILIISIVLVGLAIAGMAISILLKKGGRFPNTHVEHNEEMKKRGFPIARRTVTKYREEARLPVARLRKHL